MKKLIIYLHPDCLLKFNGSGHPERKERISTIINSINNFNNNNIEFREIFDANIEFIKLVHPENYIKKMFELIPKKNLLPLYSDTFINPNTNENKEPIADHSFPKYDPLIPSHLSGSVLCIKNANWTS